MDDPKMMDEIQAVLDQYNIILPTEEERELVPPFRCRICGEGFWSFVEDTHWEVNRPHDASGQGNQYAGGHPSDHLVSVTKYPCGHIKIEDDQGEIEEVREDG